MGMIILFNESSVFPAVTVHTVTEHICFCHGIVRDSQDNFILSSPLFKCTCNHPTEAMREGTERLCGS